MSEGRDAATLSLPGDQDELVSAVAAANSHTIVVLETGGPVSMPWADNVSTILEAWYPGIGGAPAIANILFGSKNPSAKLPVTFAKTEKDLPHPEIFGMSLMAQAAAARGTAGAGMGGSARGGLPPFDIAYTEALKVGYKWFEAEHKKPLFPFGFGLSYTAYAYSGLKASVSGRDVTVTFSVRNASKRTGAEVAQVYVSLPASAAEPPKRLVAWERVELAAGESKTVTLKVDPQFLSIFNADKDAWELVPGDYKVSVGGSSQSTPLTQTVTISAGL
jgi:beta-glucosidase